MDRAGGAEAASRTVPRRPAQVLEIAEDALGLGEQLLGLGCRHEPAFHALEELEADLVLGVQ